jgi:hypothetical protein
MSHFTQHRDSRDFHLGYRPPCSVDMSGSFPLPWIHNIIYMAGGHGTVTGGRSTTVYTSQSIMSSHVLLKQLEGLLHAQGHETISTVCASSPSCFF